MKPIDTGPPSRKGNGLTQSQATQNGSNANKSCKRATRRIPHKQVLTRINSFLSALDERRLEEGGSGNRLQP